MSNEETTTATQTRVYTVTCEAKCTVTVTVQSSSPIKAGKWFRDVAIPNGLVSFGKLDYDWTTAKATWDDSAKPADEYNSTWVSDPSDDPEDRGASS